MSQVFLNLLIPENVLKAERTIKMWMYAIFEKIVLVKRNFYGHPTENNKKARRFFSI